MYVINRLLPFMIAGISFVGYEYSFAVPHRYVVTSSLVLVLVALGMALVLRKNSMSERLTLLAPPLVLTLGAELALFFMSPSWLRHSVAAIVGGSVWLYGEEIYRYVFDPERYHPHAIEHLAGYFGVLALAGSSSGIFAFQIFLDVRLIYLLALTFVIALTISTAVFAVQPLSRVSLLSSVVVFGILVTELVWAVHFLPSEYWVNSLIVTIPFYVALHLVRHELNRTLSPQRIRRYVTVGTIALLLVVGSAQWTI